MATITSVVQDNHKEEMADKGLLAMDLAEFEVSFFYPTLQVEKGLYALCLQNKATTQLSKLSSVWEGKIPSKQKISLCETKLL